MKLETFPYYLEFLTPFNIAHTSRNGTENCFILLRDGEHYGWGECVFPPYYPETQKAFIEWVGCLNLPTKLYEWPIFIESLLQNYPNHIFGIAGLDIAYHNLKASIKNITIGEMYGIAPSIKTTSYTLGIMDNADMKSIINQHHESFEYFKLKVSESEIDRIVSCYKSFSNKPFVVDANQGFTNRQFALNWCNKLADMGVSYIEQPFDKADIESHVWLKNESPIPIIADESFQTLNNIETISKAFDGINIKLMKGGGITKAYSCCKRAKELGLKTVIGCMSESSVVSNAAWNFAPMANWVDLDGPLLLKNDPFAKSLPLEQQLSILKSYKPII